MRYFKRIDRCGCDKGCCHSGVPCKPKKIFTDEVYYSGGFVRAMNIKRGDKLTDILEKLINSTVRAIGGLRVVKNTDNTNDFLETNDFAEGWVTPTLFIEGVWKGPDDPRQVELADEDNWSNSLKIV